jgi:hypothetical protein
MRLKSSLLGVRKQGETMGFSCFKLPKIGSCLDYVDFKFISFTTRNSTNQLYYSKGYWTTEIGGCFT